MKAYYYMNPLSWSMLDCEEDSEVKQEQDRITTKIDSYTLLIPHTLGTLVAQMHAAGIIHGDLTTSNVMLRNPLWVSNESNDDSWIPQLVLIDYGWQLAPLQFNSTSTTSKQSSISNSIMQKKRRLICMCWKGHVYRPIQSLSCW